MSEIKYAGWSPYPRPVRYGHYVRFDTEWHPRILKSGKEGRVMHMLPGPVYTPLYQCGRCHRWGSPRKVCYRSDCHTHGYMSEDATLCIGCWNTRKSLIRRRDELSELKKISATLRRSRREHECA